METALTPSRFPPLLALLVLGFGLGAIFLASPVTQVMDSEYSMALSEQIYSGRGATIEKLVEGRAGVYQAVSRNGGVFYAYPIGPSVLSIPFVAAFDLAGVDPLRPDGTYDQDAERIVERTLAALLMAGLAVMLAILGAQFVPWPPATVAAAVVALGSSMWSTLALAVWSNTWLAALTGLMLLYLALRIRAGRRVSALVVGTLAAAMLFTRASAVTTFAGVGVLLLLHDPRALFRTTAVGALALVVLSLTNYALVEVARPVVAYSNFSLDYSNPWGTLGRSVFSPAKGLLVLSPFFAIGVVLALQQPGPAERPWVRATIAALLAHAVLLAGWLQWDGGFSFGARLWGEMIPWFYLALVLGLHRLLAMRATRPRLAGALAALLAITASWSIFVHSRGATDWASQHWNNTQRARGDAAFWDLKTLPYLCRSPSCQ